MRGKGVLRRFRLHGRIGRRVQPILSTYNHLNGPLFAKGLGFSFVLGGVSLLFLALSVVVRFFRMNPSVQQAISLGLFGFLPEEARSDLLIHLIDMAGRWGFLGGITIGVFVATSFALFDSLERTMALMLSSSRRTFFLGRAISLLLMVAAVTFFSATSVLSTVARYFNRFLGVPAAVVYSIGQVGSLVLTALVFFSFYHLFARRRLAFWPTLGVAFAGAFVWAIVTMGGAQLVKIVGRRFLVYGAVAWAAMFLMYMRILGEIVVVTSIMVGRFSPPGGDSE